MTTSTNPILPLQLNKTIQNLPGVLTPDSIYAVRAGVGIDLYVSDMTGGYAYKTNSPSEIYTISMASRLIQTQNIMAQMAVGTQ